MVTAQQRLFVARQMTSKKLVEVTRQSFFEGIKFAKRGFRVSDISHAIQTYVEANGFSVVRKLRGTRCW